MTSSKPFAALPEDWSSALAVVAHPDDMEYGTSCAVARWTAQGKIVRYLLATRGEAGINGMPPDEVGPLREREQWAACAAVGVTDLEFLDHPDGVIHDSLRLRREIAGAIRRHRPDVVLTGSHREFFGPGMFNMADHRVVGLAVLDAVRDAANRWVFRDLIGPDGSPLEPWNVRFTAIGGSLDATYAVDVGDWLDAGIASLREHRLYLDGLGDAAGDPGQMIRMFAGFNGRRFDGRPAIAFEVLGLPVDMTAFFGGPDDAGHSAGDGGQDQKLTGSDSTP